MVFAKIEPIEWRTKSDATMKIGTLKSRANLRHRNKVLDKTVPERLHGNGENLVHGCPSVVGTEQIFNDCIQVVSMLPV